MKPHEFDHAISIPGANWHVLFDYVWSRRTLLEKTIIYLSAGPVPLTEKNPVTKEITLRQETEPHMFEALIEKLKELFIFVIMCPLTPIEFRVYNAMTAIERPNREFYDEMTSHIVESVIKLNGAIMETNKNQGMITPYTQREILKRSKGGYTFRWWYLADGLHPRDIVKRAQEEELTRNANLNFRKMREDIARALQRMA